MLNRQHGKRFETDLKRKLMQKGLLVLKLAIPETADLIVLNGFPILLECKVSGKDVWYRQNNKQYERLMKYNQKGYEVYIVIKFKNPYTIIKFYKINDTYPFRIENGLTLDDWVAQLWSKFL